MSQRSLIERLIASGQGEGLRAQLLRGGAGVGVLRILSLPLSLLTTILLARVLGPEGFGQYSFVVAVITAISIPLAPALLQLTTRETAANHQAGKIRQIHQLISWAKYRVMVLSLVLIAVFGGFAAWLAEWRVGDRWTLLFFISFSLPLLGLNSVRLGVLTGLRRVVAGQFPELFIRPATLLGVAVLLYIGDSLNPLTAVTAFVIAAGAALIVGIEILKRIFPKTKEVQIPIDPLQRKYLTQSWVPFTLLVMATTLNAQVGILLLGWLSSGEQVAAMQVAAQGGMLVMLSLTIINQVVGPHITQVHHSGDRRRLQELSRKSARVGFLLALPFALPLIFYGESILEFVFGKEYSNISYAPLVVLVLSQLFNVALGSVGRFLVMSGYERDTLKVQISSLLVVFGLGLYLVPKYGALGASIAVGAGVVVWNLVLSYKVLKILKIRPGII